MINKIEGVKQLNKRELTEVNGGIIWMFTLMAAVINDMQNNPGDAKEGANWVLSNMN